MVELANKVKKALEEDFFKTLHKRMTLEAKRAVLDNQITSLQNHMDGVSEMLGYKPVMNGQAHAEAVKSVSEDEEK